MAKLAPSILPSPFGSHPLSSPSHSPNNSGFAASLVGEAVTGKGALAQFDLETGLPLSETEPLLVAFIGFFLLAAVNEGSGRFVQDEE